jgi:hypothetical protein
METYLGSIALELAFATFQTGGWECSIEYCDRKVSIKMINAPPRFSIDSLFFGAIVDMNEVLFSVEMRLGILKVSNVRHAYILSLVLCAPTTVFRVRQCDITRCGVGNNHSMRALHWVAGSPTGSVNRFLASAGIALKFGQL